VLDPTKDRLDHFGTLGRFEKSVAFGIPHYTNRIDGGFPHGWQALS
jgi:hypothetical protein